MKSEITAFVNNKPQFRRQCKFCSEEITLTYESIGADREGRPRHRYVPRTLSGQVHNCVIQPNLETLKVAPQ